LQLPNPSRRHILKIPDEFFLTQSYDLERFSNIWQKLPVELLTLGSMVGVSTFLPLSNSPEIRISDCVFSLNVGVRRLELHFDLSLQGKKTEEYKITFPLGHISSGSFTVNRSRPSRLLHSMFFELSVAPQMWKKSEDIDEENLKDRLFWTEHEQWVRQCELTRDPTDPTFLKNDTRIIMKNVLLQTGIFTSSSSLTSYRALEILLPLAWCT
jgi:hypothetical protein